MANAIDRSQVITETYPGATNTIQTLADEAGGWHCEAHPDLPWPHGECPGPGMLRSEAG